MEKQNDTKLVRDDIGPEPERYYDWMLWKLRQSPKWKKSFMQKEMTKEELWKKTVADMQHEVHTLQMMVVKLQKQLNDMKKPETNDNNTDSSYGVGYRQRYHT